MEFEGKCHYCNNDMIITEAKCKNCGTVVKGEFDVCDLCKLSTESKNFIKVFIECDGNIKNVEKVMSISYPTVKSKLAFVQQELRSLLSTYFYEESSQISERKSILHDIEKGELSVEEGLKLLDNLL